MNEGITSFVGLDVHQDSIAVGLAPEGREEPRFLGTVVPQWAVLSRTLRRLGSPKALKIVYEAGPCGYTLARQPRAHGYACEVIAPAKIARAPGDRIKTDRRDALLLARAARAGELVSTPAFSPTTEYNLRARYDWHVNDYKMFFGVGAEHVGDMQNEPSSFQSGYGATVPTTTWLRYDQPAYTTYDAAFGIAKDQWHVEAYGTNLSNSDASLFTSSAQFIKSEVPLRPRVLGIKVGFKF